MFEHLRWIGFLVLVFVAAWLLFRVVRKIVVAVIVLVILAALGLYVYLKFF